MNSISINYAITLMKCALVINKVVENSKFSRLRFSGNKNITPSVKKKRSFFLVCLKKMTSFFFYNILISVYHVVCLRPQPTR